jgi:hypothetical protein
MDEDFAFPVARNHSEFILASMEQQRHVLSGMSARTIVTLSSYSHVSVVALGNNLDSFAAIGSAGGAFQRTKS